jgi:signal transduction histidine kinase
MFYIDKDVKSTNREQWKFILIPSFAVFILLAILTLLFFNATLSEVKKQQNSELKQLNQDSILRLKTRMTYYEDILRGGAGLFKASNNVTRKEWKDYVDSYDIANRYPGVQGVGVSIIIPKNNLANHVSDIKTEGFGDYNIYPEGNRDIYSSIVYLEPFTGDNLKAFGYDMYSDTTRRLAMNTARDTNLPALSDIVTLVQDDKASPTSPGLLLYYPIYNKTSATVQERRENIYGFVYAPFRTNDLLINTVSKNNEYYNYKIIVNDINNSLLYQTENSNDFSYDINTINQSQEFDLYGKKFTITGYLKQDSIIQNSRNKPLSVLITGLLLSVLASSVLYMMLSNKLKELNMNGSVKVQSAKDELLALASHQLRTPATGVKQYIGMLKEGLAGQLSQYQQEIVNKAYDSNERQLATINEMLYVARADSNKLNMTYKHIDLVNLIDEIINEMNETIKYSNHTIKTDYQLKSLIIYCDPYYIRMAIENILSNAIKYTLSGGLIEISLKHTNKFATLYIKDSGVGISKKDQKLLFKKFSRIPNSLTNQVVGTGLGLYLVKKIIHQHKGSVSVISQDKIGTQIIVKLPIK